MGLWMLKIFLHINIPAYLAWILPMFNSLVDVPFPACLRQVSDTSMRICSRGM